MPFLPIGTIAIWNGSIATIPPGWTYCDGTDDTPDLRDRFLIAAGTTYDPDDSGGATLHTHPFTGPGHTHTLLIAAGNISGFGISSTTTSTALTGTTDNGNVLPPYHSLPFIMRT